MLACAVFGLLAVPGVATGSSVTFGSPSVTSTFGKSIVFTQPYSGGPFRAADIVLDFPGDQPPTVDTVTAPGTATLTYTIDTSTGDIPPFMPLSAHFQVIFDDGSVQSGPEVGVTYTDTRYTWHTATSGLITIHWISGSSSFGQQMLSYGLQGFSKSASFLGYTETKPVDFYVYPNQAAFEQGLSAPDTVGGQARPEYRTCFALIAPGDLSYASTVIPHELTHVIFADVTDNPYHSPPTWLNEGLAVYLSEGYGSDNRGLLAAAVSKGTVIPLPSLAGYFFLDPAHIYLSYAEAVSAVDLLVRKYGQAKIQKLLQTYAAGATDDEAFKAAFGVDLATVDKAWLAENGVPSSASQTYGPQPAPAGPIPPGWTSSGGTMVTPPPNAGPTAAPSAVPSGSSGAAGTGGTAGDSTEFLLAGVIAAAGAVLIGIALFLFRRAGPAAPPPPPAAPPPPPPPPAV